MADASGDTTDRYEKLLALAERAFNPPNITVNVITGEVTKKKKRNGTQNEREFPEPGGYPRPYVS